MATGSNETAVKSAGESLSAKAAKESAPPALSLAQLLATVFVTGAAVITIEILGTRIIGPVFGVSPRGRAAA